MANNDKQQEARAFFKQTQADNKRLYQENPALVQAHQAFKESRLAPEVKKWREAVASTNAGQAALEQQELERKRAEALAFLEQYEQAQASHEGTVFPEWEK